MYLGLEHQLHLLPSEIDVARPPDSDVVVVQDERPHVGHSAVEIERGSQTGELPRLGPELREKRTRQVHDDAQ